jgi:hypothetical protein
LGANLALQGKRTRQPIRCPRSWLRESRQPGRGRSAWPRRRRRTNGSGAPVYDSTRRQQSHCAQPSGDSVRGRPGRGSPTEGSKLVDWRSRFRASSVGSDCTAVQCENGQHRSRLLGGRLDGARRCRREREPLKEAPCARWPERAARARVLAYMSTDARCDDAPLKTYSTGTSSRGNHTFAHWRWTWRLPRARWRGDVQTEHGGPTDDEGRHLPRSHSR